MHSLLPAPLPNTSWFGVTASKSKVIETNAKGDDTAQDVSDNSKEQVADVKPVDVNSIDVTLAGMNNLRLSELGGAEELGCKGWIDHKSVISPEFRLASLAKVCEPNNTKPHVQVNTCASELHSRDHWLKAWESNPADPAARNYFRLVPVEFAELNTESKKFLSSLDSWELQEQGHSEDKYQIAQWVWQAYRENISRLRLYNSGITTLPPLPPAIVELVLSTSALNEVSGDLSQLTLLSLIDCRNVRQWSAKLSTRVKVDGNLDRVSPLIKSELENQVKAELSEYAGQTALTATTTTGDVSIVQNYKQKYSRSCGAASLLAIARSISCSKNPALAKVLAKYPILCGVIGHFCGDNSALQFFYEEDIYKIASEHGGNVANLETARGSLPHKIIEVAKVFGLEPTMYVNPANHYGTAIMNDPACLHVKHELAQQSITINESIPSALKPNEFEIRLLAYADNAGQRVPGLWDETTHWVVFMPDGSLMDSAIGNTYANLGERNASYLHGLVADSEVTIRFK